MKILLSKLRTRFLPVILSILMIACSPAVQRMGYTVPETAPRSDCDFTVTQNEIIDPNAMQILGVVTVQGDKSLSYCKRNEVLDVVRQDVCYLKANKINILTERNAPSGSDCVLITAQIIRHRHTEQTALPIAQPFPNTPRQTNGAPNEVSPDSNTYRNEQQLPPSAAAEVLQDAPRKPDKNSTTFDSKTLEKAEKRSSAHTAGWVIGGLIIVVAVGVLAGLAGRSAQKNGDEP